MEEEPYALNRYVVYKTVPQETILVGGLIDIESLPESFGYNPEETRLLDHSELYLPELTVMVPYDS